MTELLDKVKELFDWSKKELVIPEHIGMTIDNSEVWAKKNSKDLQESYDEAFFNIFKIIHQQTKLKIPHLSIHLKPDSRQSHLYYEQALTKFLTKLSTDELIEQNSIKVTVIGKWYDMPTEIIESIKNIMTKTQTNTKFNLNLCIKYNGKQEIVDACKLLVKKIEVDKFDPQFLTKETFKQHLYTSSLPPMNLLIKNGTSMKRGSFLLWYSIGAILFRTKKLFTDFTEDDFLKAIVEYNKTLQP